MPQLDRSRVSTTELIPSMVVLDGDYYGGSSAAVPFKWESQPGTPRRLFKRSSSSSSDSDSDSPVSAPLTPPPSYFCASPNPSTKLANPRKSTNSLIHKNRSSLSSFPASSSSSSFLSSTSNSMPSSPMRTPDLYGRNMKRSMWLGSKHYNSVKSSGCYGSIFKVFLKDVK